MIAARRRRVRLLLRDLAAASAFASMGISGQLPVWAVGVFGFALLLALFDRRILSGRGLFTALLLAASAVGLYALVAAGTLDLVLAACTFAAFISAQRMISPSNPQNDSQVHLTSLLMVAGGAALSADLLFAVTMLAFTVTATYSLGLSVIEESLPEGADFSLRPLAWRLGVGALAAVIGSIVFFAVFPRLSWNIASRRPSLPLLGQATTGVNDQIEMTGGGAIKTSPRIVARISITPDPKVDELDAYWAAIAFDTYTGEKWTGSGTEMPPRNQVELARRSRDQIHQQIELLPAYGSRILLGLEPVALFANATGHAPSGSSRVRIQEFEGRDVRMVEAMPGYTYHAFSLPSPGKPTGREEDPARYLGLPETLDPRVGELAGKIAGADRDPLSVARKIQAYLQANYHYTLELSDEPDPLADFLFVRREGHCEHFATAEAILLRTLGIPARVVGGFFGGERIRDLYVLRAGDAHAWTQVLVPERGFVTVDATPPEGRSASPNRLFAALTRFYEAAEDWWRNQVVDFTFSDQLRVARDIVRPPRSASGDERESGDDGSLAPLLGALAAGIVVYALWRLPRRVRKDRAALEATEFLDQVEAVLARRGIRARAGEGIEELAVRMESSSHPAGAAVRKVTRRYLEARFGGKPLDPAERAHHVRSLTRAFDSPEPRA